MTRLTYSRPRSKDRPAYDRPLGNKVHEGRHYVRLQPTDDTLTQRRCEVPVPGATEGTVRRLPCNRRAAWYAIWTYENGAFRNSGYFCADHRPPGEATHRKGGVALDVPPPTPPPPPSRVENETSERMVAHTPGCRCQRGRVSGEWVIKDTACIRASAAFEAMREALRYAETYFDANNDHEEAARGFLKVRAALALADRVTEGGK